MEINGAEAVVTGASGGLGGAIAVPCRPPEPASSLPIDGGSAQVSGGAVERRRDRRLRSGRPWAARGAL
jgi:hypothetical protein